MKRCDIIKCLSSGEVRIETLLGKEYLVVPVVMIIGDIVVYGINSKCPELVPASVLEDSCVECWNSRPVGTSAPYGHPYKNNKFVSANSPDVYDSWCFGLIFNTEYDSNSKELKCEAWIDKSRCEELGGEAKKTYDLLSSGETIDVSVGVYLSTVEIKGNLNGSEYGAIWTSIDADHLALLPSNQGACNQEMGCRAGSLQTLLSGDSNMKPKSMLGRFLSYLRAEQTFDDGQSDQELRSLLSQALKKDNPGFDWIVRLYMETSAMIYSTYVYSGSYEGIMQLWHRTYILSSDKKSVTLNNDAVEVVQREVWETVSDGKMISDNGSIVNVEVVEKEKVEEGKKEEISTSEPTVVAVETGTTTPCSCKDKDKVTEPDPEPITLTDNSNVISLEDKIKLMAAEINTQKSAIISSLSGKTSFDDTELETMTLTQLEKLRSTILTGKNLPIDNSIKGLATPSNVSVLRQRPLPQTWTVGRKEQV